MYTKATGIYECKITSRLIDEYVKGYLKGREKEGGRGGCHTNQRSKYIKQHFKEDVFRNWCESKANRIIM